MLVSNLFTFQVEKTLRFLAETEWRWIDAKSSVKTEKPKQTLFFLVSSDQFRF